MLPGSFRNDFASCRANDLTSDFGDGSNFHANAVKDREPLLNSLAMVRSMGIGKVNDDKANAPELDSVPTVRSMGVTETKPVKDRLPEFASGDTVRSNGKGDENAVNASDVVSVSGTVRTPVAVLTKICGVGHD